MSMVSMITNAITPALADQVSKQLGLSSAVVQKGINAIVPVLLATILGRGRQGDGANALSRLISEQQQQPAFFDNLAGALAGDSSSVSANGTTALNALLGGDTTGQLASKLGSYAGVTGKGANQLLGLGAATVMGALGKTARDENLDAAGLLNRLSAEKDAIAKAVPADFAKELKGTGLLDNLPQALAAAPTSAARTLDASPPTKRSWWPWALAAAAIFVLLFLVPGLFRSGDVVETNNVDSSAVSVDAGTFTASLDAGLNSLSESLGNITDAASAEAALPSLEKIQADLGALGSGFGSLPTEARSAVGAAVSEALPQITQAIEALMGDSAIAGIIKPVVDSIVTSLNNLTAT
ncbi:DUF937 domain-containing protein [Tropicimonas aquimaris]|uniref:DUF937 domain-containing protein n=1 Tax=Tropicimonas aquimaris TaxID=914152 RepID=A0ABW3IRX8_9RHOB